MNETNRFPDRPLRRRLRVRLLSVWTVLTAWWAATRFGSSSVSWVWSAGTSCSFLDNGSTATL